MKFIVIFMADNSGGGAPDGMTAVKFYTRAQAEQSATAWSEGVGNSAQWWDGSQWTAV
jgi:hypothetical protein